MEKELGTAKEVVTAEMSGGINNLREAVFNFLGNIFSWLSTHQGIALIIIVIALGIMIFLIIRSKKYRKQVETKVSNQKTEIGKKDKLIEEQKNQVMALQKKLSDQQTVVSQALLGTLSNLTGYDTDQLPIFFKSLTQFSGNPLYIAENQEDTQPESQPLLENSDDSKEANDENEKNAPAISPEEDLDPNKSGKE